MDHAKFKAAMAAPAPVSADEAKDHALKYGFSLAEAQLIFTLVQTYGPEAYKILLAFWNGMQPLLHPASPTIGGTTA